MADTSLIFSIIARDKTTGVMKKIQAQASSTGSLIGKSLGPALLPVLGASTGAVLGLGSALISAGAGLAVFGGVMATAVTEVNENATKFQELADKVELYGRMAAIQAARGEANGEALKAQAKAALQLEARLSLLPPATRDATEAYMGMKAGWKGFVDLNKPDTFSTLSRGYRLIQSGIKFLQPLFDSGRAAADRFIFALQGMVDGGGLDRLAKNAAPNLASLTQIIINVSTALTRMFGKFSGEGTNMLDWIELMTTKWVVWASATDKDTGINRFLAYVQQNGRPVMDALTNIAKAAVHISQALLPLAPISLAIATGLAAFIAAVPPGVITALAVAWVTFNLALKAFAIYSALATAAQWAMNVAMLANPITWIVIGIVALIAVIVLVATKTRFFQTVWGAVWGFMKGVGAWFAGPFARFFVDSYHHVIKGAIDLKNGFMSVFNFLKNLVMGWVRTNVAAGRDVVAMMGRVISFFRSAPGRVKGALSGMFNGLWSGFKSNVNRIIGGWNRLSFGLPSFSFAGITTPGFSVGTPDIPYLARGAGTVQQSGLAVIHKGEGITPAARVTPYRSTSGAAGITLVFKDSGSGNSRLIRMLIELLREGIRDLGGDPVKVLTPR